MTSSTLLFNSGIYKNTLRRFKWGSFLYFVALFFSVPFTLLVQDIDVMVKNYNRITSYAPILMSSSYIILPAMLAIVIPTIVAVLVFNNVHSQKQSIFVHGLPVTRGENYVSSLCAGFTLMVLPVIANALILFIMSITAYGQLIATWSVVYWTAINLSILFIMFSVAAFSAYLTGNTAAHIAINVFLHIIPLLVALTIELISDVFLFGFIRSDSFIANEIMSNTPIVWLFGTVTNHYRNQLNMFTFPQMWIYLLGAVVVYVLGFILYKKRKIEACGDVAAFKAFKPILKYSVTTAAAVATFGVFVSSNLGAAAIFIIAAVVTMIVYFAAEMLMNKTFKVFSKYKGYLAFAASVAIFISFFAFTSVFGYETRIPDTEDIESASIFDNWPTEYPLVESPEFIDAVRTLHGEFIEDISITDPENYDNTLRVVYKLKNGKELARIYYLNKEKSDNALSKMYEFSDYKMKVKDFDHLNIENVDSLFLASYTTNFSHRIALNEDVPEFLAALKKDTSELSYQEIELSTFPMMFDLSFDLSYIENKTEKVFDESVYGVNPRNDNVYTFAFNFNSNYKNTINFLKEKGYYDIFINEAASNLYICKIPAYLNGEEISYKDDTGKTQEFRISKNDLLPIPFAKAQAIANSMVYEKNLRQLTDGKNYMIFNIPREDVERIWMNTTSIVYKENTLPDSLKAYVEF